MATSTTCNNTSWPGVAYVVGNNLRVIYYDLTKLFSSHHTTDQYASPPTPPRKPHLEKFQKGVFAAQADGDPEDGVSRNRRFGVSRRRERDVGRGQSPCAHLHPLVMASASRLEEDLGLLPLGHLPFGGCCVEARGTLPQNNNNRQTLLHGVVWEILPHKLRKFKG